MQITFEEILDSHSRFALVVWVDEPAMAISVASELRFAITQAFAQHDIQFPTTTIALKHPRTTPKHDRHLRSA